MKADLDKKKKKQYLWILVLLQVYPESESLKHKY